MIGLTKEKAKQESLKLWKWLAESGLDKHDSPDFDYYCTKYLCACPLCELHFDKCASAFDKCKDINKSCPLKSCRKGSFFDMWSNCDLIEQRKIFAQNIVNVIEAWDTRSIFQKLFKSKS